MPFDRGPRYLNQSRTGIMAVMRAPVDLVFGRLECGYCGWSFMEGTDSESALDPYELISMVKDHLDNTPACAAGLSEWAGYHDLL